MTQTKFLSLTGLNAFWTKIKEYISGAITTATSDMLTKTEAEGKYVTSDGAGNTYLTKTDASSTYETITNVTSGLATKVTKTDVKIEDGTTDDVKKLTLDEGKSVDVLVKHQSLFDYATKAGVTSEIATAITDAKSEMADSLGETISDAVDGLLSEEDASSTYETITNVADGLAKKVNKTDVKIENGTTTDFKKLTLDAGKEVEVLVQHQSLTDYATKTGVTSEIATAIAASEKKIFGDGELAEAFDTIKEIGDYLENHDDVATGLTAKIAEKVSKDNVKIEAGTTDDFKKLTLDENKSIEVLVKHQSLAEYAKSADVTDEIEEALSGYATEKWVEEKAYLTEGWIDNNILAITDTEIEALFA